MAAVLIVCGHVGIEGIAAEGLCAARDVAALSRGTGTRGEREWTGNAGPLLADALRQRSVYVQVANAIYDPAFYRRDWDLILALHLQRDRPSSRAFAAIPSAVGVCGVPYIDGPALAKSQKWLDRFWNKYPTESTVPVTPGPPHVTANMTDLYSWDYASSPSPCAIVECGHADLDAAVLFEPGIARVVRALALITLEYLSADLGLSIGAPATTPAPTAEPFPLASFPVPGVMSAAPEALEAAIAGYCEGRAPVGWGAMCATLSQQANVRADVVAAIACHETGKFSFGNRDNPPYGVRPEMNNYGGLKTHDGAASAAFPSRSIGLEALIAHVSWYANPAHTAPWCSDQVDPRHLGPHRNSVHTLADFGSGNWNASPGYGANVARHLAEIRGRVAAYQAPPAGRRSDSEISAVLHSLAEELAR